MTTPRPGDRVYLDAARRTLPPIPADAHYVKCPDCGLVGWQANSEPSPMVCPECLVLAVEVTS